jgi:hypothetical protein
MHITCFADQGERFQAKPLSPNLISYMTPSPRALRSKGAHASARLLLFSASFPQSPRCAHDNLTVPGE